MKKGVIIALSIGAALTITGSILLGIGLSKEFKSRDNVTHTYVVEESVTSFNLNISTADFYLKPSNNSETKVVISERDKQYHHVTAKDGVLSIDSVDELSWYEKVVNFYHQKMSVTLYLPEENYNIFNLNSNTGDIILDDNFIFDRINVNVHTGNTRIYSDAVEEIKVTSTTGNVLVSDSSADVVNIKASTGSVSVTATEIVNDINIDTSTGKINLTAVTATNYKSTSSTGGVKINNSMFSGKMDIKTSTGDITIQESDALGEINLKASTGDIHALFLTNKIVYPTTSTGDVNVPHLSSGNICEVETSTGDITVLIKG